MQIPSGRKTGWVLKCLLSLIILDHFCHLQTAYSATDFSLKETRRAWASVVHSQNSLAPPLHDAHQLDHTLLRDGAPMSQISQCGCVCHSGTNSTSKLIPQVFHRVEVRTACSPFHPVKTQILEVGSDKPRSVGAMVDILED
ncbi:hypothetical protein AMECASPLE_019589 [Ameca splendens]|uniref:Uncharacterized protein n=1 Tax=Ameca splendens TaxID=208324 RepID=A0ABV0Z164_9TELE